MTISKIARKKLFVDKSRIWNLEELNIRSILFGYMSYNVHVESLLKIRGSSRNLAANGITKKKQLS